MGATHAEKSTVKAGALNAVSADGGVRAAAEAEVQPKVCSILDPECEACQ
jgi:ribonucleoside-diphosphate reductase alpha chain